jgi:hypothetical protein
LGKRGEFREFEFVGFLDDGRWRDVCGLVKNFADFDGLQWKFMGFVHSLWNFVDFVMNFDALR